MFSIINDHAPYHKVIFTAHIRNDRILLANLEDFSQVNLWGYQIEKLSNFVPRNSAIRIHILETERVNLRSFEQPLVFYLDRLSTLRTQTGLVPMFNVKLSVSLNYHV